MRDMKTTYTVILSLFVISAIVFYQSQNNEAEGDEGDPFPAEVFDSLQHNFRSENVVTDSNEDYLRVIITPLNRAVLSSEVVVTTVQKIAKRMGDTFKKGDLLVQLDATIFEGLLKKAQGNLEQAQTELESKEQLFKEDVSSLLEVKTARANVSTAEAEVISAEHSVKACTILAPYDGSVVSVFIEEHELIQQGKPLIEIVDDIILIGKVLVPSSLFSDLSIGKEVKVKIRETDSVVIGKILRIDPVIDPASSTMKVEIEIDNKERKLRAGMIGLVYLK